MNIIARVFLFITALVALGLVALSSVNFTNMSSDKVLLICSLMPMAISLLIATFHYQSRGDKALRPATLSVSLFLAMMMASGFIQTGEVFCLVFAIFIFVLVTIPSTIMTACAYRLVRC